MLDDLKYIHEKDQADALGIAAKQAAQLRRECILTGEPHFSAIHNVIHAGMGGSALPALLVSTWPQLKVPFQVVRDYDVPTYVDEHTLCIADSYSGNTEETISALKEALDKGAQVAVIDHGGELQEIAKDKDLPSVMLPGVDQPRYAVLENYRAVLTVLAAAGLINGDEVFPVLDKTADFLEDAVQAWLPTIPTADNPAKQLAQELLGKSIVVYGGPKLFPAAYKWKISFNENAKQLSWTDQVSEFDHNEFIGWTEQPVDKPYAVIDLRSSLEHPRIQKRFEVGARLLSGKRPEPLVVNAQGNTVLEQLLWTVAYGDFVSLYLALLNGLNPAPVDLVEKLKKALNE